MASATKKTELVRARKHAKGGRRRKKRDRNKGSTPKFPIHVSPSSK